MVAKMKSLFVANRELVLYCLIGCTGVAIDYLVFTILTRCWDMHYQLANALSVSMGIGNNFVWNCWKNFKVKDRIFLRFCSFYSVGLVGLGISAGLLFLFVEIVEFNVWVSKLGIIFIVTTIQFLLNKFVTFRKGGQ